MENKDLIYSLFGGRCAYCGLLLGEDWQVIRAEPNIAFRESGDFLKYLPVKKEVAKWANKYKVDDFKNIFLSSVIDKIKKIPKRTQKEDLKEKKEELELIESFFSLKYDVPYNEKLYYENFIDEDFKLSMNSDLDLRIMAFIFNEIGFISSKLIFEKQNPESNSRLLDLYEEKYERGALLAEGIGQNYECNDLNSVELNQKLHDLILLSVNSGMLRFSKNNEKNYEKERSKEFNFLNNICKTFKQQ